MTNTPHQRSVLASVTLKIVPPLIRENLINEQKFREEFNLKTESLYNFGSRGVSVKQSDILNAIRAVLAEEDPVDVNDTENRTWRLTNNAHKGALPNLVLSIDQQHITLPHFSVLSEDVSIRIRSLEESASDVNLPFNAQEKWRSIIEKRALNDDEIYAFQNDIRDTPVNMERTIRSELFAGKSSTSSLVPNSRRYFERLVGAYDGTNSILDYAVGTGREVFKQLTDWRPYEGFLFSLLLSSHSLLTNDINVDNLDKKDMENVFSYLEKYGDILSRLGAFEVGLRILPDRPEVEPFLLRLVELIRDDEVEGEVGEFNLFSSLFVFVDGELARIRLLSDVPPFYRRLASLAQAALIHRQIVQSGIDYRHFSDWALSRGVEHFYMQSLSDMRIEPRWNPDLAYASQIQADFIGRIMIAGNKFRSNLGEGELSDIILGEGEQSLIKLYKFPQPYFPGPLEGAEVSQIPLPDDIASAIEKQLNTKEVKLASFIGLVNSAVIFSITSDHADLAVKALRLANYNIASLEDKSQFMGILNGLATVAAVSRSQMLADELRILVRRYRKDSQFGFSIEEAIRISLVTSAARENLIEWREFVGEWLTELAFGQLQKNEGEVFHSHLLALLHSVPELWISCAKADAALKALCFL